MNEWSQDIIGNMCKVKGGKRLPAGKDFSEGLTPYPYLRVTDMVDGTIDQTSLVYVRPEIEPLIRNYKISKDDIYVTIAGTLGSFGTIPENLDNAQLTENAAKLCEIDFTKFNKYFLKYYFNSDIIQSQIWREIGVGGGVPKLALFRIEKLKVKYPEKHIQDHIANILLNLDGLIDNTKKAIEKYKSIKQGMLQDVFTRGIDVKTGKLRPKYENAPELYRESKLGMVPKDWTVTNIIRSTYIKGRIGWEGLRAEEFIKEGPYLVTGTDFNNGSIEWNHSYHISLLRYQEAPSIHLKNDDVLITKDGTIGKTAYVTNCPKMAILNSGIFVLRCKDNSYLNKFLYYVLNSFYFENFIRTSLGGSTIIHLYQRSFEKFLFPIPGIPEQEEIIERIDTINSNILFEQIYLHKMRELKNGMMGDLLSGKKRVVLNDNTNVNTVN